MSEKQIEKSILEYLNTVGYAIKVHSGSLIKSCGHKQYRINLAPKGTPDILAVVDGFWGIEVKRDQKEVDRWKNRGLSLFFQV